MWKNFKDKENNEIETQLKVHLFFANQIYQIITWASSTTICADYPTPYTNRPRDLPSRPSLKNPLRKVIPSRCHNDGAVEEQVVHYLNSTVIKGSGGHGQFIISLSSYIV